MNIRGKNIDYILTKWTYFLPIWQRRYEWGDPFWNNLWKSIITAYSKGGAYYTDIYFGNMLFQEKDTGDPDYKIVDGQQRLITISLILSAIRDLVYNDTELINQINNLILLDPRNYKKELDNEKIIPSSIDHSCFHYIINGLPEKCLKSDQIFRCYKFFKDKIQFSNPKLDLNHLVEAITKHLLVAMVMIDRYERSGEIFYELNYGGLELKEIDRVRVIFFADLDPALYNKYHHNFWVPIEEIFRESPSDFEKYISAIIGYQGIDIGKYPLQDFINQLREFDVEERQIQIKRFLEDMNSLWDSYLLITEPVKNLHRYCDEIKSILIRLNIIKIPEAIPLLLHWARLCKITNNPTLEEKKQFTDILKVVETYYVRNLVCKESGRISAEFKEINKTIHPNDDLKAYLKLIKAHLSKSLPHNRTFLGELGESKIHNIKGGALSRLLLFALDHHLDDKTGLIWNASGYEVEHIMPQTIKDSGWEAHLGPSWESIHSDWCHTLGNLTLIPSSYNKKYSNSTFELKIRSYSEYHYGLFRSIKEEKRWTDIEIKNRGLKLASICVEEIWPELVINPQILPYKDPNQKELDTELPPIFEPIQAGDKFKRIFFNGVSQKNPTEWKNVFQDLVQRVMEEKEVEFEYISKINKTLFSDREKDGFKTKVGLVYCKSSKKYKDIAENCSLLRESVGWTYKNWYGEAERKDENGEKRVVYFK